MNLPLLRIERVYHIGTLDPADLGRNSGGSSQEGRNLSVSLCPHAWQSIAKLGGYPLHVLSRDGGTFVDMIALRERLPEIVGWAVERGLAEERTLWRLWCFDDELDGWTWTAHETREDAAEEAEYTDGGAPEGHEAIEPVTVPVGTEALASLTGMRQRADEDATDAVLVAWATHHADGIDGMWWEEEFRPEAISAPRGAIFPGVLAHWDRREMDWSEAPSDGGPFPAVEDAAPGFSGVR